MKITGILANGDVNENGRKYSPEVLRDIANQFEKNKPMFGELGQSKNSDILLENVSHKVNSINIKKQRLPRKKKKELKKHGLFDNWKNNHEQMLICKIEVLKTKQGDILKDMIYNKTVVVRPRCFGNVNDGIINNISVVSFDIVEK